MQGFWKGAHRRLVAVALELPWLGHLGAGQVLEDPREDVVCEALKRSSKVVNQLSEFLNRVCA
jgi:hypothetical protein